jgi:hypothetical protein
MSILKSDSELETARFRQAVYLEFCKIKRIPDPCGSQTGYERIIACFIEQLMLDHNPRSATLCGYVKAVNTLFCLCHFDIPADLPDLTNMCFKIIHAREKEENVARQRSPITREMFSALLDVAKKSQVNSIEAVVVNWFTFIRITGLRCAGYAQKTQSTFDEHEYPLGKCVFKFFDPTDWKFYNSSGSLICIHTLNSDLQEFPKKLKVTFGIQKNRQNGQSITLVADDANPDICPVQAAYRIFLRSKRLDQSDSEPMGVFVNKFGITRYLTGNKIQDVLQSIARAIHPDLTEDEIKRFLSHSGRVWALVLLDEAVTSPVFMTSRLRWMGESYKLYLRHNLALPNKHAAALKKDSDEVTRILGNNRGILPDIVPLDDEMGEY